MCFGVGEHTPIKLQSHDEMEKGTLFSFLPLKNVSSTSFLLCDADIVSKDKTENCVTALVSLSMCIDTTSALKWFSSQFPNINQFN